jgi:DNA-binding response OmpR family regulator
LANDNNQPLSHKRVLCVEDDRDTCDVLRFVLTDYDFTAVDSVAAAQKLIHRDRFDLYVLDNWLPDGSGVELCQSIRELGINVPIVFTSAIAQSHEVEIAMRAGADRYLVKPYEPEHLVQTVKELLNQNSEVSL